MPNFRRLLCIALPLFGLPLLGLSFSANSQTMIETVPRRTTAQQQFIAKQKKEVINLLRSDVTEEIRDPFLKKQNDVVRSLLDEKTTPDEVVAKVLSLFREAHSIGNSDWTNSHRGRQGSGS